MSNYYDSLAQDLPPMIGMEPIDATKYGPQQPPPMPAGPPPNLTQPAPPNGLPLPPPMPGGGRPMQDDPFNKALTQSSTATQMFSPTAPGIGYQPGGQPPTHPPANLYPPVPPPNGQPGSQAGGPPPMPPGMTNPGAGGSSVPFGPSTDYRTAMGIAPTGQDRVTALMGGLGKGLSAAAGNSNKAGAVFSRGAGGAMTGTIQEQQEQQKLASGLQNQYMNQVSTAFKDLQQKRNTDSLDLYRKGLYDKNEALATNPATSKAFLNTPDGKLHIANDEAQRGFDAEGRSIENQFKMGLLTQEEAKTKLAAHEQGKQAYFDKAYSKYGVDPDFAANAATRGLDLPKKFSDLKNGQWYVAPDGTPKKKTANSTDYKPGDNVKWINPFDANKMNTTQAHQNIPENAYAESGGKIYIKGPAPAGVGPQQTPQARPAVAAAAPPTPPPMRPDPMADPQAAYGGSPYPYGQ